MSLREYHKKRDFKKTAEPRGRTPKVRGKEAAPKSRGQLRYLIQKHAASHLHYDFRLELDGTLKSWAVPKGPSLDPAQKRLAVAVEDHPLEYGNFEGTIPAGEYGGGTVMLWDRGSWQPHNDPRRGFKEGKLEFDLEGEKLHGVWLLVRKGGRSSPGERNWFLFKKRDHAADETADKAHNELVDILEAEPDSVASHRTMEQIAAGKNVWHGTGDRNNAHAVKRDTQNAHARNGHAAVKRSEDHNGRTKPAAARRKSVTKATAKKVIVDKVTTKKSTAKANANIKRLLIDVGAKAAHAPKKIVPQLASLVNETPSGGEWQHEIKYDGYRIVCHLSDGHARLVTRNEKDWTERFHTIAAAAEELPCHDAIIDGEVVALGDDGVSRFQLLQQAFMPGRLARPIALVYYAFDLLHLDGHDLRSLALVDRKRILAAIVPETAAGPIRFAESLSGKGAAVLQHACKLGLEGIISKRGDRPYHSGRSYDWVKSKCHLQEEFVIGGFTRPQRSRHGFGALLLGYYNQSGKFTYAGRVGTGFSDKLLDEMHKRLAKISRKTSPFDNLTARDSEGRGVSWTEPRLIGQIEFSNWTDSGYLRQPVFLGLREDKSAKEIVRDAPAMVAGETDGKVAKVKANNETSSPRHKQGSTKLAAKKATANTMRRTTKDATKGKTTHQRKVASSRHESGVTASRDGNTAGSEAGAVRSSTETAVAGVHLTHPDKLLFSDAGITKGDLAEYYATVAESILPHVVNRPLSLKRCPDGASKACFFQKHATPGLTGSLDEVSIVEKTKRSKYLVVRNVAGLVSIAQMGGLEIHVWGSKADDLERPDRLVFDLDPDVALEWSAVVAAARRVRERLDELKLTSFVKTTGGKGLHVVVPIAAKVEWPAVKEFCRIVAVQIAQDEPAVFVSTMSKAARRGKIFIDYLRNERGSTSICTYSSRALPTATVSTPIDWRELPKATNAVFTVETVPKRLKKRVDAWEGFAESRQDLRAVLKRVGM